MSRRRPPIGLVIAGLIWLLPTVGLSQNSETVSATVETRPPLVQPRQRDGRGKVRLPGEHRRWHKLTLQLDGPFAHEMDTDPNPFLDYRMEVEFRHEAGRYRYTVPGYFATDGESSRTSAQSGRKWHAHIAPEQTGKWYFQVSFVKGKHAAINETVGVPVVPFHGVKGSFRVESSDKKGRDFRAQGRLLYLGERYLRFAQTGKYFLKAGPDAPETLLAYADFDGTTTNKAPLKKYNYHQRDWRPGDPTWSFSKGRGLIGAVNYLAGKGLNSMSFLPYNAGGDGDNVWPFVSRDEKRHYDCSKLAQWQIVFDHAQSRGIFLHFKLQEQEMDDNRLQVERESIVSEVATSLDGGELGTERKLYLRELVARFGYALALNWNLGEENTQSPRQQIEMIDYLRKVDAYNHPIVVHTFPWQQDQVYNQLLGDRSRLAGVSLQNLWNRAHQRTLHWVRKSQDAGRPWVVCNDEQGYADLGVPPDPGYEGFDGIARDDKRENAKPYNLHDIRKLTLWGTLMAGGAGVEYYFGYKLPENDLKCEDWRSRDKSWDYCRIALDFFQNGNVPFHEMENRDELIGNVEHDNSKYCFAKANELYLVYLPSGGTSDLDLTEANGDFTVLWFNPRKESELLTGEIETVTGGSKVEFGLAPVDHREDWLVVIRKK